MTPGECRDCGTLVEELSPDGYCEACEDILDSLARYSREKAGEFDGGEEEP